jgi:hypothetical protein
MIFLAILWCSSWKRRLRLLVMLKIWFLGCIMSFPKNPWKWFAVTMSQNSRILILRPFVLLYDLSISFPLHMCLNIMTLLRWPGQCLMSIGLLGVFGSKRSTLLAMCQTTSFFKLSWTRLHMSMATPIHMLVRVRYPPQHPLRHMLSMTLHILVVDNSWTPGE